MPRDPANKISRSKPVPIYKQGWFAALSAVLGLASTALALYLGASSLIWKPRQPVEENVEIVLDRSENMKQPFEGGSTKLEAAVHAVETVLRNQGLAQTNLAYREFGGDCNAALVQTPPIMPFSQNNAEAIRRKADDLVAKRGAHGAANLVDAIQKAIGDFGDHILFGAVSKQIIVITGDADACDMKLDDVHDRLSKLHAAQKAELDFRFIAVGLEKSDEAPLNAIAKETNGEVRFAHDQQQLADILHQVMLEEPGQRAAEAINDILDAGVDRLDKVTADVNGNDYAASERNLQQAREEFVSSELPFQVLANRRTDEKYRSAFDAAQNQRKIQSQLFAIAEAMLTQARAADQDKLSASREAYSKLIVEYNTGMDHYRKLLAQLRPPAAAR